MSRVLRWMTDDHATKRISEQDGRLRVAQVTRRDHESVLVPAIEDAPIENVHRAHAQIRLYYQIEPDFGSLTAGAMWQDLKIGVD